MKAVFLSHVISRDTPSYGSLVSKLSIETLKSISRGDSSNVFRFTIENHLGTHVDCPAHFFADGSRVAKYTADAWFFNKPFVVQVQANPNQVIFAGDLGTIPHDCDLLLVKTGFQRYRGTEDYSCANPGLDHEVGNFLRKNYPSVRAIGLDVVSISPFGDRELGRKTHRAFLDPAGPGTPIFIIEDMNMDYDLSRLGAVWVLPLRIEGLDSAPCTVAGILQ